MVDPVKEAPATTPTEVEAGKEGKATVLDKSDQPVVSKDETVLDTAGAEEKAALEAENKRLLDADPSTLTPEEVTKREGLVAEQEKAKAKALADEKAKGVPEKYELKAPEGMELDDGLIEASTPIFKEIGLTNEQAQKLVDLNGRLETRRNEIAAAKFKEFLESSAKETMDALGANAKTELALVAKMKDTMPDDLRETLNGSGMSNQKSFIFWLAKIGKMFAEDKLVDTGKGSAGGKSPAEILYPSMNKK